MSGEHIDFCALRYHKKNSQQKTKQNKNTRTKKPLNLILPYEELRVKTFPLASNHARIQLLLSLFMQKFFWHKHIFTYDRRK